MVETMVGVWLLVLTMGAGFLWGRYGDQKKAGVSRKKAKKQTEMGWQELLNFLQYDGSGLPLTDGKERRNENGET
jgi:hypothetical protein